MQPTRPLAVAIIGILAAAGCGVATHASSTTSAQVAPTATSAPRATTAPTVRTVDYKAQYAALVAPMNAYVKSLPSAPSAAQVAHVGSLMSTLAHGLLVDQWPASASQDVHAMAVDLEATNIAAGLNEAYGFNTGLVKVAGDAQVVRAELGMGTK